MGRVCGLSHLSPKERAFYEHLLDEGVEEFAPIDAARAFGVTNRTVINWSAALAEVGLLEPSWSSSAYGATGWYDSGSEP